MMKFKLLFSSLMLILWMSIIFYVSSLPNEHLKPETSVGLSIPQSLKHIVEFGVLGMLAATVALQISQTFPSLIFAFCFSSFYGMFDEIHQAFVPTRYCTVVDMYLNMGGSLIGIVVYVVLLKFKGKMMK